MAGPCSSTQRQRSITRRGVAKRCWTVLCLTFVAGFVLHAIYISMSLSVLQQEDLLDFAGSLKKTVKQLLVNRSFCFFHCDKKIAWLMSFPNSGTTYTIANTEQISMLSTATNYAVECVQTNVLQPLYSYGYKSPFLFNPNLELPDEYVLTKTHCTGYCDHCHHSYLVQNFETFIDGCRTYTLQRECGTNQDKYSLWHVKKYIHLVRDPFDNIMARKHLGVSERRKEGYADRTKRTFDEAFLSKFDDSSGGLTAWCEFMDELFHTDSGGGPSSDDDDEDDEDGEVRTVEMLSEETLAIMKDVPCHSEWFRYVQWHNMAAKAKDLAGGDEHYMVLYYEDYSTDFDRTVKSLANFLQQPIKQKSLPFKTGKTYGHLFSKEYKVQVAKLIKQLATPESWRILKRYLEDILVEANADSTAVSILSPNVHEGHTFTKFVWLAGFTQSGTIYTNKWLNNITDGVAATNYKELVQGAVTPVRPDIKYSPFIVSDDGSKPGKHVLVQTQCSRTCATCQPIDDPLAFRQSCRWVNAVPEQNRTGGDYPEDLVQGIVIQLRNPYDVIRTRVNRGIKSERKTLEWTDEQVNERKNTRQALESYCKIVDSAFIPNPSDRRTLFFKSEAWKRPRKFFKRAFCEWRYRYPLPKYQMVDAFYESSKRNFHYFSNATKFSDIPCFWDWLRYIQWHNYLLEFATKFPTHVVYFEDYMTDRKHAFEDLAAFMDRKIESPLLPPLNLERAKHIMLYTPQEQSRIAELVHHFASPKVLEILQPYLNISAYNSPPMTTTS